MAAKGGGWKKRTQTVGVERGLANGTQITKRCSGKADDLVVARQPTRPSGRKSA